MVTNQLRSDQEIIFIMDTTVLDTIVSLDAPRTLLNIVDSFSKFSYSFVVEGKTTAEVERSLT